MRYAARKKNSRQTQHHRDERDGNRVLRREALLPAVRRDWNSFRLSRIGCRIVFDRLRNFNLDFIRQPVSADGHHLLAGFLRFVAVTSTR